MLMTADRAAQDLAGLFDAGALAADLEALAKGLLEFETLTGEEIQDLLKGKKPNRESVLEPTTPRTSAVPPAGKPRPRPDPDAGLEPQPQA